MGKVESIARTFLKEQLLREIRTPSFENYEKVFHVPVVKLQTLFQKKCTTQR